ncbi:glycine cleavage system protein H [Candidatus Neomarinimicrobiota bacterium]
MSIIFLITFAIACVIVNIIWQYRRKLVIQESPIVRQKSYQFDLVDIRIPRGIFFGPSHTWTYMLSNGNAQIGMDDFLSHITGPTTNVSVKQNGDTVEKGESILDLEFKGNKLNVYSPISGRIQRINEKVLDKARIITDHPYGDGWIYEIEPDNWQKDIGNLHLAQNATDWIRNELNRLKDFFSFAVAGDSKKKIAAILQDGGQVAKGALVEASTEVWEKFQTQFLDVNINPSE